MVRGRLEAVIAERIRLALKDGEVDLGKVNKAIRQLLRSDPPNLPTASELWSECGGQLSQADFSFLLGLLAQCGGAVTSRKKIYLSIGDR